MALDVTGQAPADATQARLAVVQTLLREGHLDAADALSREIVRLEPRHAEAVYLLGLVALQKGATAAGVEYIQQSLRIDPHRSHVHFGLGNALMDHGQPAEALASYDRALALRPDLNV